MILRAASAGTSAGAASVGAAGASPPSTGAAASAGAGAASELLSATITRHVKRYQLVIKRRLLEANGKTRRITWCGSCSISCRFCRGAFRRGRRSLDRGRRSLDRGWCLTAFSRRCSFGGRSVGGWRVGGSSVRGSGGRCVASRGFAFSRSLGRRCVRRGVCGWSLAFLGRTLGRWGGALLSSWSFAVLFSLLLREKRSIICGNSNLVSFL